MASSPVLPVPACPYTNTPTEVSMNVWWQPSTAPGLTGYRLEWRQFPQPWESAKNMVLGADVKEFTVHDLFPTSTYEFRLYTMHGEEMSPPSMAVAADTLAAGCGGKEKKQRSCVVM